MLSSSSRNPLRLLKIRDWILWGCSVCAVTVSELLSPQTGILSLTDALIGVTALIFMAKGHYLAQILIILFSVLYGAVSFSFRYYGEMLTYIGMTLPMAVISLVSWLRNPYDNTGTVAVQTKLPRKTLLSILLLTAAATALFGLLLAMLRTARLPVSILSVATSFLAAALTACRSPFYALAYAANDLVLIVLWILAARLDASCIPMVVNFCMFLCNDIYGFLCWKQMASKQQAPAALPPER